MRTLVAPIVVAACMAIAASATVHAATLAGQGACPTLADGRWRIVAYGFDSGVIAVSEEEARSLVGKTVTIGSDQVVFAGERCEVKSRAVTENSGEGPRGFSTLVDYECQGRVFIPVFFVGSRCNTIWASRDGGNFKLARLN